MLWQHALSQSVSFMFQQDTGSAWQCDALVAHPVIKKCSLLSLLCRSELDSDLIMSANCWLAAAVVALSQSHTNGLRKAAG